MNLTEQRIAILKALEPEDHGLIVNWDIHNHGRPYVIKAHRATNYVDISVNRSELTGAFTLDELRSFVQRIFDQINRVRFVEEVEPGPTEFSSLKLYPARIGLVIATLIETFGPRKVVESFQFLKTHSKEEWLIHGVMNLSLSRRDALQVWNFVDQAEAFMEDSV